MIDTVENCLNTRSARVSEMRSDSRIRSKVIARIADFMNRETRHIGLSKYVLYCLTAFESGYESPPIDSEKPELGCEPDFLDGVWGEIFELLKTMRLDARVMKLREDPYGVVGVREKRFIYGIYICVTYTDTVLRECKKVIDSMEKRGFANVGKTKLVVPKALVPTIYETLKEKGWSEVPAPKAAAPESMFDVDSLQI